MSKRKDLGSKHYNNFKAFIANKNNMDEIYENIEKYSLNKLIPDIL